MAVPSTDAPRGVAGGGAVSLGRLLGILFIVVGLNQLGTGMLIGVVPVQLSLMGYPATVVGWVSTGQSAGFVVGCLFAAPLIAILGGPRTALAILAVVSAVSASILPFVDGPVAWTIARAAAGFTSACVIVLFEAWFASLATPGNRGMVFGLYMVLTRATFMFAQIAMAWVEPRLSLLFGVAALCYLAVPLVALRLNGLAPAISTKSMSGIKALPSSAPAAAAGAFVHALVTSAASGLFPVYAVAKGVPVEQIAFLLAAIQFGGLVLQLPLSLLSDRIGRRSMMAWAAAATVVFSAALWRIEMPSVLLLTVLVGLWAGFPAPLYSLAVAHANDIASDGDRVAWSSAMLFIWGIGAAVGPVMASMLMVRYGAGALFIYTGVLSALLMLFLGLRKLIRKRPKAPVPSSDTIGPAPQ